jgi:beta-galactosidase/beta-glucuronidase
MLTTLRCAVLCIVLAAFATPLLHAQAWAPADPRLLTRWAEQVDPDDVWPEYPRPQLVRADWTNLNGLWDFAIVDRDADRPGRWDGSILVPFAVESALSGVGRTVTPEQRLWYHRTFTPPVLPTGHRLLLHFGAVDWDAQVYVNGERVGEHRGGYTPFSFDITAHLREGENELVVAVWDPTDTGFQPRGKQVLDPRGIWYTAVTGIWQTVWLEPVPDAFVRSLQIVPDVENAAVTILVHGSREADVRIQVSDQGRMVGEVAGRTGRWLTIPLAQPRLWSPESPFLYDLSVTLLQDGATVDHVGSYFGMRSVEVRPDHAGVNRLFLNGEPVFMYGPLDQGWWPDGLYTAPTDEALRYDIEVTRDLGFNMTRKHVKVEPARWYYWADRLGLLVWQDMPNGDAHPEWVRDVDVPGPDLVRSASSDVHYRNELKLMVDALFNHPSIITWVPFNERWGQYHTDRIVGLLRSWDPTRLINSASGGNFHGVGDILSIHSYPGPAMSRLDPHQAAVLGEFGGLGLPVEGHTWLERGNWGYRSYETREELQQAYLERLDELRPMIPRGLAAAVYTQITDVEIEVNGLLTYDRALLKFDREVLLRAHRSLYDALPAAR